MNNPININREFGDCEIRSISFSDKCLYVKIFDPAEFLFFTIIFYGTSYFQFTSDHLQNVIDSISVYDSETIPTDIHLNEIMLSILSKNHTLKVAHIRPLTGGEAVVFCARVDIE